MHNNPNIIYNNLGYVSGGSVSTLKFIERSAFKGKYKCYPYFCNNNYFNSVTMKDKKRIINYPEEIF